MTRHFIKIDQDNNIIKTFTDAFEEPDQDSILVNEDGDRHFNLDLMELKNDIIFYKYKYENGQVIKKTEEDYNNEINSILESDENKLEKLRYKRDMLIMSTIWILERHLGEKYGRDNNWTQKEMSLIEDDFKNWLLYWEALRDLPETIDLSSVTIQEILEEDPKVFPAKPSVRN